MKAVDKKDMSSLKLLLFGKKGTPIILSILPLFFMSCAMPPVNTQLRALYTEELL